MSTSVNKARNTPQSTKTRAKETEKLFVLWCVELCNSSRMRDSNRRSQLFKSLVGECNRRPLNRKRRRLRS